MTLVGTVIGAGLNAARPAASAANNGYLWLSTDVDSGTLYRSNGSSWVQVAAAVSVAGSAHAAITLAASADALLGLSTQEVSLDVQNANKVLAGPTTGGDAAPTFRALVAADLPAAGSRGAIEFGIDGVGAEIADNAKFRGIVPYDMTIDEAIVNADQAGSIVVDIWVEHQADYPPTDADSITSAAPITLSSADHASDSTLTGWTKTLTKGQALWANVDSCTTITSVTIALLGVKS